MEKVVDVNNLILFLHVSKIADCNGGFVDERVL